MSERDDRYARNDVTNLPSSTAQFRATPDSSASTAQFRAFASGLDESRSQRPAADGSWPEQPWAGEPAGDGGGGRRTVGFVIGAVVLVAAIAAVVILALGG